MTTSTCKLIFSNLGYSDITTKFIETPNIARIVMASSAISYREPIIKYRLDVTNELLYKAAYDEKGKELGVCAIIPVSEILAIETRNTYSALMFAGHNY